MVDGVAQPSEDYVDPSKYFVGPWHALDIPFLQYDIFERLADGQEPQNPTEKRLALQDPLYIRGGAIINQQNKYRMANMNYGPSTPTQIVKGEFLEKLERETQAKIIYGELDIDQFDQFVEDWKAGGGDQITAEVNEWFDSVKAK